MVKIKVLPDVYMVLERGFLIGGNEAGSDVSPECVAATGDILVHCARLYLELGEDSVVLIYGGGDVK